MSEVAIMQTQTNTNSPPTLKHFRKLSGGAEVLSGEMTRFRVWAPEATKVCLVFAGDISHPMQPDGNEGWYQIDIPCVAGALYSYRITNKQNTELQIPDPMSRAQVSSVHGESIVIDPEEYQWKTTDWSGRPWHESIIYELHPGLSGGYAGIKSLLPSLAEMGFTAIELMPIASFPGSRNWGYDGVLQFAPQFSYGTPNELKALVDEAHALGLSIYLDVVYNHFGPDGNYLYHYAPQFFCNDKHTPWGCAIDYAQAQPRSFFTENVLYWLDEYQFDGLRLDACHSIWDKTWLEEVTQRVRKEFPHRQIHLIAENDDNCASLLTKGFDAQWNDDGHHVLHVLLTGEIDGYYSDYASEPAQKLARCLAEGFVFQGENSAYRQDTCRGEPSGHLPPTSFVLFLQNHDQIGNRPLGERLSVLAPQKALRAANALLLLSPQIPMMFMGEEYGATQPFNYFTSHDDPELIKAIFEGRKKEFASFNQFSANESASLIPDPNHPDTFLSSLPDPYCPVELETGELGWREYIKRLLAIRHEFIIPRLLNAQAISAEAIGSSAIRARWQMGDLSILTVLLNLGQDSIKINDLDLEGQGTEILFEYNHAYSSLKLGVLPFYSLIALLESSP